MTFTVTYRGADGAVREEAVEAASRAACIAQCRARGLSPMGVAERRSGRKTRRSNHETRRSNGDARRSILKTRRFVSAAAVVLVALAGGALWWWLGRGEAEPTPAPDLPKRAALAKEVKPAAAPKAIAVTAPLHTNAMAKKVSMRDLTPEERDAAIAQKILDNPPDLTPSTNRAFRTGVEQVASWLFTTRLGDTPPPLPRIGIRDEAHLRAILDAPNVVFDTDSEKVAEAKQTVAEVKKVLADYLSKGGNVQEFFEYYHGQLREAHDIWRQSQLNMLKVLREEPEAAPTLIAEMNADLAERGIKPLMIPPKYREMIETEK